MAQTTLLTDDVLGSLMAVGQVDIVVGLPTLNHAATIAAALKTADEGLARFFPRERTVIICPDGGSRDGTPDIVLELASRRQGTPGGLRTRHQICAPYRGMPGRAGALRLLFTAADLLQARAIAVLDPEVTSLTPAWIATLVGPVARQPFDFVAPTYGRHPLEGLLVTQLVRPLLRAACGRQIDEPLAGEFGCSGRFAARSVAQDVWEAGPLAETIEVWITASALTGDYQSGQAFLGARTVAAPPQPRPGLGDIFPRVVGALFAGLDRLAGSWLDRQGSEALPVIGDPAAVTGDAPAIDPARLGQSFAQDVRDLRPVLESILAPETFARLSGLVEEPDPAVRYPDDLWVATVYDFLAAHHAGVMDRAHIARALMPLYLGRVASFVTEHAGATMDDASLAIDELALAFERAKPYLIERWNRAT